MTARRVVVVDDDENVRSLLRNALPAPDYQVIEFSDPREALMRLHDLHPDLIICDVHMPELDGRTFLRQVKKSFELKDVPFVVLSGIQAADEIIATLDSGADDFVNKPFHVGRFTAKLRALLRASDRRRDALSGPVGPGGPLQLMKFCEDSRLSGRLIITAVNQKRWADFVGGEMVQAAGTPETAEDPLDALLALQGGFYRIEQRKLDREALNTLQAPKGEATPVPETPAAAPVTVATAPDGPPPPPAGRLSMVEVRGQQIQVQTEAENRPNFVVTTVLVRSGQILRKIESAWQHPLQRREDHELARTQIDRQHDRAVATLKTLAEGDEAKRAAAAPAVAAVPTGPAGDVDGRLLAWAASFTGEQVRDILGAVMTVALLRRTGKQTAKEREALRPFRVLEDGRVVLESGAVVGTAAVEATAAWITAFLAEAAQIDKKVGALKLRTLTKMMEAELEKCGFYAAFDALAPKRR